MAFSRSRRDQSGEALKQGDVCPLLHWGCRDQLVFDRSLTWTVDNRSPLRYSECYDINGKDYSSPPTQCNEANNTVT